MHGGAGRTGVQPIKADSYMEHELQINSKVWMYLPGTSGVFGDGKVRLLEEIGRSGSLTSAARELNISYRKAWDDLRKAESCVGFTIVERHRGGAGRGSMQLTQKGAELIAMYQQFRRQTKDSIEQLYRRMFSRFWGTSADEPST